MQANLSRHRIILTGGPGGGKTTILEALRARGMQVAPDVARAIIKERMAAGLSRRPEPKEFGQEMLKRDIAYYGRAKGGGMPTFFDRGAGDSIAFLYMHGAISMLEAEHLMDQYSYDQSVFVVPPWRDIFTTDSERDQTFEESVGFYHETVAWYEAFGYSLDEVPIGSVEDRTDHILAKCAVA